MYNEIKVKGKMAQIGETMAWIVATIVIIVVLVISIIIADLSFGKNRNLKVEQNSDVLASKSMYSWLLTKSEGENVYSQIKEEGNLNDFNGNLGVQVFSFFDDDYSGLWLGVADSKDIFPAVSNDYFLTRRGIGENPYSHSDPNVILDETRLDENKTIALVLPEGRK